MAKEKILFTSESVTEGHPDKISDNISDAILDALMDQDPMSRVACETAITTDYVLIMGEITTKAKVDYEKIARETIREIGYDSDEKGFNCDTCKVNVLLDSQSADIAMGVDKALEAKENQMTDEELEAIGAGDQGMMFGYACRDTKEYLPTSMVILQKLSIFYDELRKKDKRFLPDGKAQITGYYENNKLVKIKDFVICYQNTEEERDKTDEILIDTCKSICNEYNIEVEKFILNPTGKFLIGGFTGDAGLTGRKIIVDTYGGYARHGGGAFSGKDPTKVDRSAAYAARYVAKNLVAAGLCDKAEIQLSYAIGVAHPTSIHVETFGTGKLSDTKLVEIIRENFDLRPAGIIKMLDLRRPIYRQTAAYGHFGRTDVDLPWEHLDKVDDLKKYLA